MGHDRMDVVLYSGHPRLLILLALVLVLEDGRLLMGRYTRRYGRKRKEDDRPRKSSHVAPRAHVLISCDRTRANSIPVRFPSSLGMTT